MRMGRTVAVGEGEPEEPSQADDSDGADDPEVAMQRYMPGNGRCAVREQLAAAQNVGGRAKRRRPRRHEVAKALDTKLQQAL
jgi:hypothetical protein